MRRQKSRRTRRRTSSAEKKERQRKITVLDKDGSKYAKLDGPGARE